MPDAFDMDRLLGISAVDDLINNAKRDVIEGTYEKILAALKAFEQS